MSKFIFKGVLLSILSGNAAHGILYDCSGGEFVEDFKTCILKKSDSFIREINLKSYRQAIHLNIFTAAQMIFPEDGSVGEKKQTFKPTLKLDPLFVYMFCLFDIKDLLLYVDNPLIVPRSCIEIGQDSSYVPITIKVRMCFR